MFSRSGFWGLGGGKKTRNPPRRSVTASGTRHSSPRGGCILGIRVSAGERQALGPLSQLYSPSASAPLSAFLPLLLSPPPPPPGLARKPAGAGRPRLPATRSLAGLRALRSSPSACPTLAPKSQLRKTSPGAAWKGEGGRRGGRRPGPGFLPLPPPVPNR